MLSAAAMWCVLWPVWDMNRTRDRHFRRVVVHRVEVKLHYVTRVTIALSCGLAGIACQHIGAGIFLGWAWRTGWPLWLGYLALWLATTPLIVLLMLSWWPGDLR